MKTTVKHPSVVTVATLSENLGKDGYELRFPGNPGEAVLTVLREHGWRFNPQKWKDPLWWKKRSPEDHKFAANLVRVLQGENRVAPPAAPPAVRVAEMVNVRFPKPAVAVTA
jgi:hypothetical protein